MEEKKLVRAFEEENACLIFDDTIIEKPYTFGYIWLCKTRKVKTLYESKSFCAEV